MLLSSMHAVGEVSAPGKRRVVFRSVLSGSGKPVFQLRRAEGVDAWTVLCCTLSEVDDESLMLPIFTVNISGDGNGCSR